MLINNQTAFAIQNKTTNLKNDNIDNRDSVENRLLQNDKVNISTSAKTAEGVWQEVAAKFDVNNISRSERGELASTLVSNGMIKSDVAMQIVKPLSMNESSEDRVDFLSVMKGAFEFNQAAGLNRDQLELQMKAIELLERLKKLR